MIRVIIKGVTYGVSANGHLFHAVTGATMPAWFASAVAVSDPASPTFIP